MTVGRRCLTVGHWTVLVTLKKWKIQELVNKITPTMICVQSAVLLQNQNFQGRWSTSRRPWTFL